LIDIVTVRDDKTGTIADWGAGARRCAIGPAGIGEKTREGDGITPVGVWPVRRVLYRADRQNAPNTNLPIVPIEKNDGWCDAPEDNNYNLPIKFPYAASAEKLWRADALYDVVVVVGFNDAPVVAGRGSAIFVHVATKEFAHTEGCVALKKEDLLELLAETSPATKIRIDAR
jgi:L,D-peptidoglycan transpeptidase YkuD (ErfK/YbiS/YcfS/YnhG family)